MSFTVPSPLLKQALLLDACCTLAVAALQLAEAQSRTNRLGLPTELLIGSAVFMALWVVLLLGLRRSAKVPTAAVNALIVANVGWALASFGILAGSLVQPTVIGGWYVVVQAVAVLIFAALQYVGLKRSASTATQRATSVHASQP